ncbi:MAG TPA: M23 family metallopeptidase [Myxococcota bacterium]|nr:M23 family metallopeptidase [Myxococcota bacterium]HND33034.1 M23 family metallopeptidase [Myxococcota bacterium]HNH47057.1 M23 family metallopeptidase [Myxococcota bacterium]
MWMLLACTAEKIVESSPPADSPVEEVARAPLQFRFPLPDPALFNQTVGVDHDPTDYEGAGEIVCSDYLGRQFPWCYDGHDGSDYLLIGGFDTMDSQDTPILAALDGVVVETDDGHYDRCHATTDGVDCDGNPMQANFVILEHEGGIRTKYWHMKKDSVAVVVGQAITCGDTLGLVGSSGNSSMPHLHFEVEDATGQVIDPYAGPMSQEETWWVEQGDPEGFPGLQCSD